VANITATLSALVPGRGCRWDSHVSMSGRPTPAEPCPWPELARETLTPMDLRTSRKQATTLVQMPRP
jgi:hypothetical protein